MPSGRGFVADAVTLRLSPPRAGLVIDEVLPHAMHLLVTRSRTATTRTSVVECVSDAACAIFRVALWSAGEDADGVGLSYVRGVCPGQTGAMRVELVDPMARAPDDDRVVVPLPPSMQTDVVRAMIPFAKLVDVVPELYGRRDPASTTTFRTITVPLVRAVVAARPAADGWIALQESFASMSVRGIAIEHDPGCELLGDDTMLCRLPYARAGDSVSIQAGPDRGRYVATEARGDMLVLRKPGASMNPHPPASGACGTSSDCPFFRANRNYSNRRGRCISQRCEMPVAVPGVGPVCHGCARGHGPFCCKRQADEAGDRGSVYGRLKSADFAFYGDSLERTNAGAASWNPENLLPLKFVACPIK